ncbi:MAG: hypothetical protein MAG451_01092 [Anaerolineales bacterium]|nr:hypothetical protein [Anaerolineales bacterium]
MVDVWASFLWFVVLLIPLVWLQREISGRLLHTGWLVFNHELAAVLLYFLVMLPGILIHEISHLIAATLLGVKAGGLSLRPKVRRDGLQLGSVQVARTDIVRESLIGLAPLIGGSSAVLLIASLVFEVPLTDQGDVMTHLQYVVENIESLLQQPNATLWLYLIFAVSNAMLPSPSDRQPWQPLAIFVGIIAAVVLFLNGGPPQIPDDFVINLARAIDLLALAFAFTLLVDLVFVSAIFLTEQVLLTARG